jgi:hypothetical protein
MGLGVNAALSMINPNEGKVERMAREESRMANLNATIDRDREIQRRDEEQWNEREKELEIKMNEIAPQDQEKVRTQLKEARDQLYGEFKSAGSVSRFMRKGGMKMVQEYQNKFVNSSAMARGRQNAYQLTRMDEFNKNKIPISKRSQMEYNAWQNGKRDSFEVTPLQKIDLSELQKTKFTSQAIPPYQIMQQFKAEITANWLAETGSKSLPTDQALAEYTADNYGTIMGSVPDRFQTSERYNTNKNGRSSSSNSSGGKSRTASGATRNQATMVLTSLSDINKLSENGLKVEWGNNTSAREALDRSGLVAAGIIDPRQVANPNSMDMSFQEGYEVKGFTGQEALKALGYTAIGKEGEKVTYAINTGTHSIYNSKGISAANNEKDGLGIGAKEETVTAGKVMMVKKRNTMFMPGRNEAHQNSKSMLMMNSADSGEQKEIEERYNEDLEANGGQDEISLVQILELTDSSGHKYYMEIGNIPNEVDRMNTHFKDQLEMSDVIAESYDQNSSTINRKLKKDKINKINKEQYDQTLPQVNSWLNETMLPVDENFVAPLFNGLADFFNDQLEVPNSLSRKEIIEREVIPLMHQLMRDDDDFKQIFLNDQENPMKDLLSFVRTEMPEILNNLEYYTKI